MRKYITIAINRTKVELKLRTAQIQHTPDAYQSYQSGIEIDQQLRGEVTDAAINRTKVELKLIRPIMTGAGRCYQSYQSGIEIN